MKEATNATAFRAAGLAPRLSEVCARSLEYLGSREYRGHDPYDVWSSAPWRSLLPAPKSRPRRMARAAALRILRRWPRTFRRLGRVPERLLPETLAHTAEALLFLDRTPEADRLLVQLQGFAVADGAAWGLGYDHPGVVPLQRDTPVLSVTLKAYHAFARRSEESDDAGAHDQCRRIAQWTASLWPQETDDGLCFPYAPGVPLRIHNANVAAAEILGTAGSRHQEPAWCELAEGALAYWLADWERGGGFEYFGVENRTRPQSDHVHTALVVRSLAALAPTLDVAATVLPAVADAYLTRYFDDGIPSAPNDRGWTDVRAVAEALRALHALGEPARLERLTNFVLDHLTLGDTFVYRLRRRDLRRDRTPYIRWVHAPLTAALCAVHRTIT